MKQAIFGSLVPRLPPWDAPYARLRLSYAPIMNPPASRATPTRLRQAKENDKRCLPKRGGASRASRSQAGAWERVIRGREHSRPPSNPAATKSTQLTKTMRCRLTHVATGHPSRAAKSTSICQETPDSVAKAHESYRFRATSSEKSSPARLIIAPGKIVAFRSRSSIEGSKRTVAECIFVVHRVVGNPSHTVGRGLRSPRLAGFGCPAIDARRGHRNPCEFLALQRFHRGIARAPHIFANLNDWDETGERGSCRGVNSSVVRLIVDFSV
jgi:hypothetical protein